MPTYDVDVEGSTYEVDAPDPNTAWQWANYTHRKKKAAAPKPATGLLAAAGKGLESLLGVGRTAAGALTEPEEAARAGLERQKKLEEKYADQVSWEKVKEAYEKRGILPAVGEAVSQIPYALAEQAPNLAATLGSARLGAMAGAPLGPYGAIIGGGIGAFAPSFIQQFGGNIERQAAEQEKAGKPLDISRAAAAAAAGPQAALDVAATFIPLGRTVAGKVLGPEVKALLERGEKEAAEKLAKEGLGKTLLKGTAIGGAAEVPTEITQQVLERAQAGLSLTDDDALKEYGETAYQVGLLAPLGAAGRLVDRSAAKSRVAAEAAAAEAKERKATREAEEAKKKDPQYLLDLETRYKAALQQKAQLDAAAVKPSKGSDPATMIAHREAVRARDEFAKTEMNEVAREYASRKKEIDALNAQRQQAAELAAQEVPQMEQKLPFYGAAQETIPGLEPAEAPSAPEKEAPVDYAGQAQRLRGYLDDLRKRAQSATDIDAKLRIGEEYKRVQTALKEAETLSKKEGQTAEKRVESLRKKMSVAEEQGDIDAQVSIAKELKALGVTDLGAAQPELPGMQTNFFAPSEVAKRKEEELTARAEALTAARPDLVAPTTETDPLALWKASVEETEEQATEELLRPNFEAGLTPSGPPTVAVAPGIKPIQNPTTLLKRIDDLTAARDKAAADADSAFSSGNKELGVKKSQEREAAQTALNNLEQTEGPGRALTSLRKAQDTALMNAAQLIDDLKAGRTLGGRPMPSREAFATDEAYAAAVQEERDRRGTASSTPQTLINQINKQRDAYITAMVQEAAATRRLYAKALTQEEATKAANQIRDVFNEWVTRSMAQPRAAVLEERVVTPAQMRGTEVVRGAETERVDPRPLEERRFGAYKSATQVLQEQLRQIASRLSEVPKEGRRVEPTLKMQFPETEAAKVAEAKGETTQTLEGQLRRRRDYAQGLIDQAFQTRRVPGIAQMLLTRAQDFLPTAPNTLLDAVENVADRILRGQTLERSDLIALRDEVRAASARPGEAEVVGERVGQRELFPAEERRALAPKEERGAVGLIREKPEAFQAVRAKEAAKAARATSVAQRSEQLTQSIRTELARIDKERQEALEAQVEERRDSLQSAWQSAVKKAKTFVVQARKAANLEKLNALKKEIDAIRKGGIEGLNKETIDRLLAARTTLDSLNDEINAAVDAAEFLPVAQANKWVAYERGALEQAEKALAASRNPATQAEVTRQQTALQQAEQARLQSLKGEEKAAEAARMRAAQTGLGLPGQRRVEGRVEAIEPEKTAAERAAATEEARVQAREESAQRQAEKEAERTALEQRIADLEQSVERRKGQATKLRKQTATLEASLAKAKTNKAKAAIQEQLKAVRESGAQKNIDALNKDLAIARGQLAALGEAKPRKKGPATAISGAGIARQRPLRTGYRKALEGASEALRKEREGAVELPGVFEFGPQEKLFSRGATSNPSTIDSLRTELSKAFTDLGRVQIYDSVDALIAANPQYKGKIPSDARGFVDTAGNKAFLIAENINQGQALSVLLHEVGAHIGLKNMLGEAQYNTLVNAVQSWEKRADNSTEAKVAQAARARVEAAETKASQVNDELLAYAIEEAVNAGVKPTETKGVIGRWLSQIAALFRKALERFGLPPKALDAQGIVDMAFGAAKMEMRPAVPQMSRRQFLRGAGAALGAMKLPPLSKEMNLKALRSVFEGSLSARDAWFGALKTAVKGKGLGRVIDQYEDVYEGDNALVNFTQSEALQDFLQRTTYDENYQGDGYDYYLNELLSGKDGVKVVADLQQALRAQGAGLVEAAQRTAKEKGLPEVGELFFSGTEKTSAFKRWFGGSKIVDAQGKPLVVYHGTDKDFTTFDAEKPKTSGAMHGKGFYFADAAQASSYADAPSGGGLVMPVYLKMERPFIGKLTAKDIALLRKEMPEFDAAYKKFVAEEGTDEYTPSIERLGVLSGNRNEFIQKALRTAGYDGRIVTDAPSAPWTDPDTEYVVFEPTQIKSATGNIGTYDPKNPDILFSRNLPTAARVANQIVGQQKGWLQKLRENFLGIGGRAQFVDMRFPLEEALKRGGVEDLDAMQAMYYVRMYDQKMHFTSEAITEGVPQVVELTRKDGRTERVIEAKTGANLTQAYKILTSKAVIKEAGSADAANKLVTLYMAAIRGANKGYDKLNFGRAWATQEIQRLDGELKRTGLEPAERANLQKRKASLVERLDTLPTVEDIKASRAEIEANPVLRDAFDKVREVYNEYNRNLLELAVQTGAISRDHARTLLAQNDYIPYYRMRGGVAEMVIGGETPIRIGNIKDNQELQELVGGDEPILDFITSSMQNTSMLVDMSLRNIAMKNAMFELRDVGLATIAKEPKGGAPKGSVTFKKDGEDYYAMVNTDALGISSDLLVKGLSGIPTMFPMWVRAMGVPARWLRRAIVAAPPYWAKQVFRDSLGASMASGADIVPILGALRQIGKDNVLERRGVTGGQVFTGLPEDKKRMLAAMQSGKVSLTRGMAWLEATSAKADALTRKNQYENYLEQGLSEMEATYMALESMNFSKRGLSPSVHYANILIPFFNSQIQGLDALYKAFTGQMPMNERLEIRQKLWTRGMFMFAMSMAYAAMMQDDEAYKNAKPEEKYGNWFVPLQNYGIDATLRLPIPFELGYIFKALPEALVNMMMRADGGEEAFKALKHIVQQTIPGGSSLGIPAAVKPAIETVLGVSSYTGRPLESAQEQMLEPGYRARENTTELARQIGEMTNFSPVKLEFLVRGYTGSMGMAALAALSAPFGTSGPEPATKRLSDLPVVGTMFQPKDASGIIDATYEKMTKVNQLKETYEDLLNKGRTADAQQYYEKHKDDMAFASLAGSFKQFMGEITQVERAVRAAPNLTPDQKRQKLDELRQAKIRTAQSVRGMVEKSKPQAAPV